MINAERIGKMREERLMAVEEYESYCQYQSCAWYRLPHDHLADWKRVKCECGETFGMQEQHIHCWKSVVARLKEEGRMQGDALAAIFGLLTDEPQWTTNREVPSVVEAASVVASALHRLESKCPHEAVVARQREQIKTALTVLDTVQWTNDPSESAKVARQVIAALTCPECKGTRELVIESEFYADRVLPCPSCCGGEQDG